ncbi:MAG TPA: hypothetical protein VNN55_03445 [bacterium]|nr:hypothetical protein [bacterium]
MLHSPHIRYSTLIALALIACSGGKGTSPDNPPAEVHAPWENAEAEAMAVVMGGQLAASARLYDQVSADLAAIRQRWGDQIPALTQIHHAPKWRTDRIAISLDVDLYQSIKQSGFPPSWTALNQSLRLTETEFADSTLTLGLRFDARLAPQMLARLYQDFAGVRWVKMAPPDSTGLTNASVDGYSDSSGRWYLFSNPPNFCPKLCKDADLWFFHADDGGIDSVGAWTLGNPTAVANSVPWWPEASRVLDLAFGPGAAGDFPDSDHVAPAAPEALTGTGIDSRTLLVRWTGVGDDGNAGVPSGYELTVTASGIGERAITHKAWPRPAGQPESLRIADLLPARACRVVIRAVDEQGNRSAWSPPLQVSTLGEWTTFSTANTPLESHIINAVAIDGAGRVWCASHGGRLVVHAAGQWTRIDPVNGQPLDAVTALAYDMTRDLMWCGGNGFIAGVAWQGSGHRLFSSVDAGLSAGTIVALFVESDGTLWASDGASGVARWGGDAWTLLTAANSGLPHYVVWDIDAAPDGSLWFGTGDGAAHLDDGVWTVYTSAGGDLGAQQVFDIEVAANGNVWCGHQSKFAAASSFDGSHWLVHGKSTGWPANWVYAILTNRDSQPWIGTSLGLVHLTNIMTILTPETHPLANYTITDLALTADQVLWIATPTGLTRYEIPLY